MRIATIILFSLLLIQCGRTYQPKPYAYPRIFYPERAYESKSFGCPFSFEAPVYTKIVQDPYSEVEKCWKNVVFKPFNATVHLTYRPFNSIEQLDQNIEDTYKLAFKHIEKAEEIVEREINFREKGLTGIIYDLEGKTATPFNFFLTDSKQHFIRGSFYFNEKTELDSVAPIYNFLLEDINRMIETFEFN